MTDGPWIVGAEVVRQYHRFGGGRWGERTKIAKVYKNGNVVPEDELHQQYRPWRDGRATATGDGWHRPVLYLLTPELEAKVEAETARDRAVADARALADRLEHIAPGEAIAHLPAIRALLDVLGDE